MINDDKDVGHFGIMTIVFADSLDDDDDNDDDNDNDDNDERTLPRHDSTKLCNEY